jgi:hypothetical protein
MSSNIFRPGDRVRYTVPDSHGHTVRYGALATVSEDECTFRNAVWLDFDEPDSGGRTHLWSEDNCLELYYRPMPEEDREALENKIKELTND